MTQALVIEQGRNFRVVGKAPASELGKERLAVGDNLERRAGARDHLDLGAIAFYQQVPRTERTRLVVSRNAVFDPNLRYCRHFPKTPFAAVLNPILNGAANRKR